MAQTKRILCLIDSLGAGGAQRQMVGLATFLKERGYDVVVVIYHPDLFYADNLLSKGVPYVFLKKAKQTRSRLIYISRYIRKVKPDIVISYLDTPGICASFAHIVNGKFRLFVSERNTTQVIKMRDKVKFLLYHAAEKIIPNSYSQEIFIKDNFSHLANKVVTIPNFVDLQHFFPNPHKRKPIPEIVIVASIWHSKNTLGFIDAVELLVQKGIAFHVKWYGKTLSNSEYFEKCQAKISDKGLSEYILLLEKTNRIAECYRESDYFCLPSFYEGTPNVICEAMASGLPIACSSVCDNPRYVEEGGNGFLFDPKDANSIASVIEKMLSLDDDDYISFCKESRKRAEVMLSKEQFVNSYINLIENECNQ